MALDKDKILPEERRHTELMQALLKVSNGLEEATRQLKLLNECIERENKRKWWERMVGK